MNDEELRAAVAKISAGDTVTATFKDGDGVAIVKGQVRGGYTSLDLFGCLLRHRTKPGYYLVSIDSHIPATPDEPLNASAVTTVIDRDGEEWRRFSDGLWRTADGRFCSWKRLNDFGPLTVHDGWPEDGAK